MMLRMLAPRHRVVTTFHYLRPVSVRTALLRIFFLLPAAFSDAVVVTTEAEASYAKRFLRRKQIEVIPAGLTFPIQQVTAERRVAARSRLGFSDADFVVAHLGFLLPNKGLDTLLVGLTTLPERIKLLVIGGSYQDGDRYPEKLKAAARGAGLGSRIVWTGEAPEHDISGLLAAADCAALPFDEGACLKRSTLLLALAAAIPVVTTDGPERDRVMVNGENLLLVPPRDPDRLAAALSQLQHDPTLGKRLVDNRNEILDLVSWASIARRHDILYRDVCERHDLEPADTEIDENVKTAGVSLQRQR
jgi:glycosyltransferase involved in cell wall biosynthesis